MVPVAAYHLFHLLFLHFYSKILILYAWRFFIDNNTVLISQFVYKFIIWIMNRAHKVIFQVFRHIKIIHYCYPFRNCITKPWILLMTVSSMNYHFRSIHVKEVLFIVPAEPSEPEGTCISINNLFCINYL